MRAERQLTAAELLGLGSGPPAAVLGHAARTPQLDVAWGSFRQSLWSSLTATVGGPALRKPFRPGEFFKDAWIERRIPRRAVAAAALWHVALFLLPFPDLPAVPRHISAFDNVELTWSGPINDLPLLDLPGPKPKPAPRGEAGKPLPPNGADAFHLRQRIFTNPVRPTHPRQTLINFGAPPEAPKILPNLPNIVELAPRAQPARPRLQISPETLKKLRPREHRVRTVDPADASSAADATNLAPRIGEISLVTPANAPAKPKLQVNATSAPRAVNRSQARDVVPAPEMGSAIPGAAPGSPGAFIALSATPALPTPNVQVPQGNLAARVSISPEGTNPGVPGGAANSAPGAKGRAGAGGAATGPDAAANSIGVSISGGHPEKSSAVSSLGDTTSKLRLSPASPLASRQEPHAQAEDAPPRTEPPNFAALPPGAKPEAILGSKRVYTLYVNMPNLNSVTGSWILNFSEFRDDAAGPHTAPPGDLTGPVPLRKVDPKYPPTLIKERVEGEVILYAVIRRDGSVDSIQLVRGIDEELDANAMRALAQWRFRPAERQGVAVELEAIVHIPFRFVTPE